MTSALRVFEQAVRAAGEILQHRPAMLTSAEIKSIERRSQAAVVSTIMSELRHFLDIPVLVEERDPESIDLLRRQTPGIRFWEEANQDGVLIDPCDGTIAYEYGCPEYAVSVAQIALGKPIRAAILLPVTNDIVLADIDEGCYINGARTELQDCANPGDAIIGLDLCRAVASERPNFHCDVNISLIPAFAYVRNMPSVSSGVDLLLGRTVAHVTGNAKIWDVAGTACAVQAAGGVVSQVNGKDINWTRMNIEPVLLACGDKVTKYVRDHCQPLPVAARANASQSSQVPRLAHTSPHGAI